MLGNPQHNPPVPDDEDIRLSDLYRLQLLDTAEDPHFQRIVNLASEAFQVPISLISLVDSTRQWFLARHGLDARQTSRQAAFCGYVIADQQPMVVEDALEDPRFLDNPLVTGEPRIRFYAGAPIFSHTNQPLGTLCVIDHIPREFGSNQLGLLTRLTDSLQHELYLRHEASLCRLTSTYERSSFLRIADDDFFRLRVAGRTFSCLTLGLKGLGQMIEHWGYQD